MPYYEVVYETGNVSVMAAESDEAALAAAAEHDRRAREGGQAGPQGGPAERIAKLYKYDTHPNEYNPAQTASADVLQKEVSELVKGLADSNGVVNIDVLSQEIRGLSHPMTTKEHPHDSQFKMKEVGVLTLEEGKAK